MQTISNVNKPCSIHSPLHPNQKRKRIHDKFTRCKISCFCFSKPNQFQDKNTCVSCPVNRCSSRNIPCKRREHILLDRQSSLFMLHQLHCQIVKAYVAQCWRNTLLTEKPADVGTRSILPRTKKSANSGENDLHFSRNQSHNGQRQMWSRNLKQPN